MKEFILECHQDGEPIQPSLEIGKNQCKNCRYWDLARLMKDMPIQSNGTIQDVAPCKLRLYEAAIIHNCPEAVFFMTEYSPCYDDSFRFSGNIESGNGDTTGGNNNTYVSSGLELSPE